tara:strand:- start:14 stop:181 length:168 start_codon:yes stop_codon:yes gene_type:complete
MIALLLAQFRRWQRYQATQRVLETLDAHTLKDVGLHRRNATPDCERVMLRTLGMR